MSTPIKLPVYSFFSLTNIVEKTIIVSNIAKSFSRKGYRTLLIDLDFDVPMIYTTLQSSSKLSSEKNLFTNEWLLDSDFNLSEVISQLQMLPVDETGSPKLLISPCSNSNVAIQQWQTKKEKEINKLFRRLNKFIRQLKTEKSLDVVIINLPNSLSRASFPIMSSSFSYAITDHDLVSNSLLKANLEAIAGIHPLLKFSGVIVDKFAYEYPEKDREEIEKLEDILEIPVLTTLPSLRTEKYLAPETLINWTTYDQPATQSLFTKLVQDLEKFAENPRKVRKKSKSRIYSLFAVSDSGLPLLTRYFLPQEETDDILASAGLSSLISGVTSMISEIVDKRDQTKLIELKKVILIIEEMRGFKFILLVSKYDEKYRETLRAFGRGLLNKYQDEIHEFLTISKAPSFKDVDAFLTQYFN